MRTYHIIDNNLGYRADAMQAEFQARGGRVKWHMSTATECKATFFHPEYQPDGFVVHVSLDELKQSGVAMGKNGLKSNYIRSPRQMLRARAISEGVRAVDPGVVAGAYTPEEISDGYFDSAIVATDINEAEASEQIPASKPEKVKSPTKQAKTKSEPSESPQRDNDKSINKKRAEKAISAFSSMVGIIQADLEAYLGDRETGEVKPADQWSNEDIDNLLAVYEQIHSLPQEQRAAKAAEVFELEPGAMG